MPTEVERSDAELRADDIAARKEALDVQRSFIVQAPAGSGKTELLIQRYLKLLTIVDSPEEILAITFTRKAAMEMRLRVMTALRRSRDKQIADAEHEKLTLGIAAAVLARDAELGWQLVQSPGRMRIETVDAFSAGIARSLPVSSGIGGSTATIEDSTMSRLYRMAAAATLDWLTSDDAAGRAVKRLLVHLDNNTGLYISHLSRMLPSREQWLGIVGSGLSDRDHAAAARDQLEKNIASVIEDQLRELRDLLPTGLQHELLTHLEYAAANLQAGENPEHPLAKFADIEEVPGFTVNDRESWQAIVDLLLIKSGAWRKSITKKDGFPAGDAGQKKNLYGVIEALQGVDDIHNCLQGIRTLPPATYSDEQWDVLLALFNVLPLAVVELTTLFSEYGVTDHAEVGLAASLAMGTADDPGDIALALDYRIRHLLVDEMQDTSIAQYGLLKSVTAGWMPGDGRTAFCVGDPMQSIYRFRDAEVGEFLLARQNGIGTLLLESLVLRRNFRSGENLVHWFNTVFGQVFPIKDDIAVSAISYSESVPVEMHAGKGEFFVHPLFGASAEEEAAYSMNVIGSCLQSCPEDDLAVLVRSRTQLPLLLHQLRDNGIPYQAIEVDRLTDLPEITDVIALTRALCDENDRLAWLALMRAPWVGLLWTDLHALVSDDLDSSVLQLLSDADRIRRLGDDVAGRIDSFVSEIEKFNSRNAAGSLRDRIELAWIALGGPATLNNNEQLDNVYRFFDVLDNVDMAGSLEDVHELERMLDFERVSSPVSDDSRVRIMTMHKAKGLEFDHVVLFGLGRMTRVSDTDVLNWLYMPDDKGRGDMIMSPVGSRSDLDRDPLHRFISERELAKERSELDRLLYVACTRARKSLHLVGHTGISDEGDEYKQPNKRSLLSRLWPALESVFASSFEKRISGADVTTAEGEASEATHFVAPVLRRLKEGWRPPELPAPPRPIETATPALGNDEKQVEFYWVGSAARYAGTIVHRWLHRFSEHSAIPEDDEISHLRSTSARWARGLGVADEQVGAVCDRVEQALNGILGDEKGRWVLIGDGHSELPLTGVVDGGIESIIVDRVRIDDDGVHWIVDYKTSTHEGGDLQGFLQQESDRYRSQLEKYAAIYGELAGAQVRTALYFPLLKEFCEIPRTI